jgi:Protein of unknown function (DUF3300)
MTANFKGIVMNRKLQVVMLLCVLAAASLPAQDAAPPPMPAYQELSPDQLDQLLGPIALYPDPLMAQVLAASTLPTQIVLADRYVSQGGDPNQIDQQPWDASVQAVAHYPSVLKWMDDNLDWTTELGQAFLNQQPDVMASIQRLRAQAQNLGNLQTTPQQQVVDDGGDIEILPADPDVIYVPSYVPASVYYQNAYGGSFISFGIGFPIGVWLNYDFDWRRHNMIVWNHDHPRPVNWWHEAPAQRAVVLNGHPNVWRPVARPAGVIVNRGGDRGWGDRSVVRSAPPVVTHPVAPHEEVHTVVPRAPAPVVRTEAPPVERVEPVNRPAPNNAFIGIQSSRDTRDFSERGQQSMQQVERPAPAPRAEPAPRPAPSGGGGGGNRGSSQRR